MKKIFTLFVVMLFATVTWADIEEGTEWKEAKNNPNIYFDNSYASYSNVSILIGRQYTHDSNVVGSSAYPMTKIGHTNLYYANNVNFGWFTTFCIINDSWNGWETNIVSTRAKSYATSYTSANNQQLDGYYHLFTAANETKGAALSYSYHASVLDYEQKIEIKIIDNNGVPQFQRPMPFSTTISGYKFGENASEVTSVEQISQNTQDNNLISLALTSQATFSAEEVDSYTFLGWYTQEGELVSTESDYTFTVTGVNYLCAHYAPKEEVTLTAGSQTEYYATFSKNFAVKFHNAEVYAVTADGNNLSLTQINDSVPANTGVLLKATGTKALYSYVPSAKALSVSNMLKPGKGTTTEGANCKFYKLAYSDGKHTPETLGFYYGAAGGAAYNASVGKAYLAVPTAAAPERFLFNSNPIATDLESAVKWNQERQKALINGKLFIYRDGKIYHLNGMLVK